MRRRRPRWSNKRQNVLFDVNPDVLSASKMRAAWRSLLKSEATPYPTFQLVVPPGLIAVTKQLADWTKDDTGPESYAKHVPKTVYQDSYSTVPCGEWAPQYSGASSGVCLTCGYSYPSHLEQVKSVHDEVIIGIDMAEIEAEVIAD